MFFSEATYMCLLPMIINVILQVSSLGKKKIRIEKKWSAAAAGLSILYILMLCVTEVVNGTKLPEFYQSTAGVILKIVLIGGCFVSNYFLTLRLLEGFLCKKVEGFKKIGNTPIYVIMIPVVIISFVCIAGCYPGILSSDSAASWLEVMKGNYSDWHPVTYLYILKVVQKIFGTPYPIIIFQALFWIIINQYVLFLLEKYAPYRYIDVGYLLLSVGLLASYRALGNLEKDTLWNMAVFAFSLGIFELIKSKGRISKPSLVLFLLSALMTATIRHGGVANVLISLAIVLFVMILKKDDDTRWKSKIILAFMLTTFIVKVALVDFLGFYILNAVPNEPYVKYNIPMAMVGAVAVHEKVTAEELSVMEKIMPLEKWQKCYDKYYADTIDRPWEAIGEDVYKLNDPSMGKEILFLNAKFLIHYPKTYLTAYFDMTNIVWEMGTPVDGYEWMPISIYSSAIETRPELKDLQIKRNAITTKMENIVSISDGVPIWNSICWRGGFAIYTLLLSAVIFVRRKRAEDILAFLPGVFLGIVLMLANPSQDPRYINSYQMMMSFFLIYALTLFPFDSDNRNTVK